MIAAVEEFDLTLASGRIRARRLGPAAGPLTLLVHGLSGNLTAFDVIAERLASPEQRIVAIDLRGRGRSEMTPTGTYGLKAHALDILEVATQLGAESFDLVGWSMGALIGILIANAAPQRLGKFVLIDHAGRMDASATERVVRALARLDAITPSPADYLAIIREAGGFRPWSPFWDRYFTYELAPFGDGWKATTNALACLEDVRDVGTHDWPALWKALVGPTMLLRCQAPLGGGFIVPEDVRDALMRTAPHIRLVEQRADHYAIMATPEAAEAIAAFLRA